MKWYKPQLKEIDVELLIKSISAKASSVDIGETDDCYGGNILKGDVGGSPTVPGIGGDWPLYCIEYGPLGGCDNWAVCSKDGITILSNNDMLTQ